MRSRILFFLTLLISLGALGLTHWLTGLPQAELGVRATVPAPQGHAAPAVRVRFDILTRSAETLIDSLCRVEVLHPPDQVIRALEDQGREAFLRGAIERRGFILSPQAQQTLLEVSRTRQRFMEHLRGQPRFDPLIDAVQRVHGPLADLVRRPRAASLPPLRLRGEISVFDPSRIDLYEEAHPEALTYDLYYGWVRAVEAYDLRYHRDLIERAIVAAALYRASSIASVETDNRGHATFPAVGYGRYWISGYHPSDVVSLNRAHRVLLAGGSLPDTGGITVWNLPVSIPAMLPEIELTRANARPVSLTISPY